MSDSLVPFELNDGSTCARECRPGTGTPTATPRHRDDDRKTLIGAILANAGGGNPCVVAWLSKPRRPMTVQVIWMAISPILEAIEEGRLTSVSYGGQLHRRRITQADRN